jgi:hypothetical protein
MYFWLREKRTIVEKGISTSLVKTAGKMKSLPK